jgi:hypothetical protein
MQNDSLVGRNIIVTDTPYKDEVPNGTVMTVINDLGYGSVAATVNGGDGFNWCMTEGSFEFYTELATEQTTEPAGHEYASLAAQHGIKIAVRVGDISVEYDGRV